MNKHEEKILNEIKNFLSDGKEKTSKDVADYLYNKSDIRFRLGLTSHEISGYFRKFSDNFEKTKRRGINYYKLKI